MIAQTGALISMGVEGRVRRAQDFEHLRELARQIAQHADILRALSWEEEADVPGRDPGSEVDSVGLSAQATFQEPGEYLLRAVASDGSMFSYENLAITVNP